jgi:polar amino acid transport system substrate-binding protein
LAAGAALPVANASSWITMIAAIRSGAAVLLALLIFVSPALTQTIPATLRVETFVVPPFVIEQDGKLSGFAIELWEEVASRLKTKSDYRVAPEVAAGFDVLRAQKVDLIVSGVLITPERDKEFDFSYAILEAGQQVMVRNTVDTILPNPFLDLLGLLLTKTTLLWLGIAVLFMLIPAHLVWLLERRYKDGIIPTENYIPGIFYAMHWSATTLLTQAEQTPRQPLARVVSFVWMFTGIVFVALYTAQLTANLTVHQIRGAINGPADLPGKQVGTVKGASVPINYLRGHNAKIQEFSKVGDMFQALLDRKVDALLFPAPVLRYYAAHEGTGLVKLVGPEFDKREAGFVLPEGSPLRRQINSVLVAIREDGTYQRIYDKWFRSE